MQNEVPRQPVLVEAVDIVGCGGGVPPCQYVVEEAEGPVPL